MSGAAGSDFFFARRSPRFMNRAAACRGFPGAVHAPPQFFGAHQHLLEHVVHEWIMYSKGACSAARPVCCSARPAERARGQIIGGKKQRRVD
jgi:hypothetical protein